MIFFFFLNAGMEGEGGGGSRALAGSARGKEEASPSF